MKNMNVTSKGWACLAVHSSAEKFQNKKPNQNIFAFIRAHWRFLFLLSFSLAMGLLLPFSYAPYDQFWLVFPLLGGLFFLMQSQTARRAGWLGWLFGLGWFAHGIHWIYYSLHYHGGTPLWLVIIILAVLSAYLALFPALAMYLAQKKLNTSPFVKYSFVLPALWAISEWLRGWLFTGFPWLQIGYTQVDTPLAGYAPLVGGLGVSFFVALTAGLLLAMLTLKKKFRTLAMLLLVWCAGWGLLQLQWVENSGKPLRVALLQGNVAQSQKWQYGMREQTMQRYLQMTEASRDNDLIVWPETAVPDFANQVPEYIQYLRSAAEKNNNDVLFGIFTGERELGVYYNSVVSVRDGVYKKRHLVPLGEYFPFRELLNYFRQWINIPLSDIAAADFNQTLIKVSGHAVGVTICFEDAFDRDVIRDVPAANMLINVSNDAWFEDSIEPWQHHQIARMRALEAGRYLLRATNTGVSSVIDNKGRVIAQSPQFQVHVLTAQVQPLQGRTPYAWWRNYLLMMLLTAGLLLWYQPAWVIRFSQRFQFGK